jgi:glycosyltransferase involved in cell wall biosynthesis
VALYQKAGDILLMPFPDIEHYAFYMSPLKMFEYMASRRPIVASDLPSIREILNENNAVLVKPGDCRDLAVNLRKVIIDKALGDNLAQQAFKDAQEYSWEKRAAKILDFIN